MTISISETLEDRIKAQALRLGFDVFGLASVADPWPAGARLAEFIDQGRHGSMDWIERTAERRAHPRAMWPAARSAIVLGLNYGPEADPLAALDHPDRAAVSVYAQGDDYHELIKPLAQSAGLGWQGKHTNLVSRAFGSWLFLGSVLTDLALQPDDAETDHCGVCHACLDICPTHAFPAPYQLDARRCISYLTIEHAGPVPEEFRAAIGNRIYGCDDCLAVCPWNKFAQDAREAAFHARDALRSPPLADLARLDDTAFRALFARSPVKRIGRDRFVRNVLYAIGNSGEAALADVARSLADDPSEVVRDAAAWAVARLAAQRARGGSDLRTGPPD